MLLAHSEIVNNLLDCRRIGKPPDEHAPVSKGGHFGGRTVKATDI